jgi:hypothetical protein
MVRRPPTERSDTPTDDEPNDTHDHSTDNDLMGHLIDNRSDPFNRDVHLVRDVLSYAIHFVLGRHRYLFTDTCQPSRKIMMP